MARALTGRCVRRADFISLRGPDCDALRCCPRFALFYMAAL